jgi:hypothetical protein
VAGLVARTPAACRQLARRARLSVGTGSYPAELTGARSELTGARSGTATAAGRPQAKL